MSRPIGVLKRPSAFQPELALPDLLEVLGSIVRSAEPAVVFSSVAQLCVPMLSARARIAITEADDRQYLIAHPLDPAHRDSGIDGEVAFGGIRVADDSVVTEIQGDAVGSHTAFRGVMVLEVAEPRRPDALVAQLVVDRAVAVITAERQAAVAAAQRVRADNLERGMLTSREIGIAIGIVMSRHKLTQAQAFELLRLVSQDTNRKLRDVAVDVVVAGDVSLPRRPSL
jgi:ANTAR domain-containing protein